MPCTYFFEDREVENVRFVQEALVRIFCKQWKKDDRIIVFTTYEANDKNWRDGGLKDEEGRPCEGLETRLSSLGLQCEIRQVMIPEGHTAEDIWKIFDQACDQINNSDTVIFDITHAFRSIPMLAMVVLQYLKILKKIQISGIYYGAFEVLGPAWKVKEIPLIHRRAPVVELTDFVYLADWATAVDRFLAAGDGRAIADLVKKKAIPVIKTSTTNTAERKGAMAVRDLADSLANFSGIMATCRGLQISEAASKLIKNIDNCEVFDVIPPLLPLLEKLKESVKGFQENDDIANGLQAARWCLEHNLVQQAYTILQETLVSLVLCQVEDLSAPIHLIESSKRQLVTEISARTAQKKPLTEAREDEGTQEFRSLVRDFLREKDVGRQLYRIQNRRNDLNHAGINKHPAGASSFKKDLQEILDWFESIQQHIGRGWE